MYIAIVGWGGCAGSGDEELGTATDAVVDGCCVMLTPSGPGCDVVWATEVNVVDVSLVVGVTSASCDGWIGGVEVDDEKGVEVKAVFGVLF